MTKCARWLLGPLALVVAVAPTRAQSGSSTGKVTHRTIAWIDSTRPEPWTADSTDHRAILVYVSFRADTREARPLILFSGGRDVSPSTYADLADALAQRGYVVAIVDHLGERSGQRLPDGTAVPNRLPQVSPDRNGPTSRVQDSIFSRRWIELRADDLSSARTHLLAIGATRTSEWSGLLDGHAAAAGHSIGGITAAKACERDPAFAACVNLDGLSYSLPMHVDGIATSATQPFLFIGKPIPPLSDAALAQAHMTRAQDDSIVARFARRFDDVMRSVKAGSYRVVIQGADHMAFAAAGSGTVARTIREYMIAFLDTYVLETPSAMLDRDATNPGVTITRYKHP